MSKKPSRETSPSPSARDLHSVYDSVAAKWNRNEPWVRDELIAWDWILEKSEQLANGGIILDCGCATGNFCRPLSMFAKEVIGIDYSAPMIEEAIRQSSSYNNIRYIHGNMLSLKDHFGPDSRIDLCISVFGFCCLTSLYDIRTFLRSIREILSPTGHCIIQIPHPLDGFFNSNSKWVKEDTRPLSYFESGAMIQRQLRTIDNSWLSVGRHHYTLSEYLNALSIAGFQLVETREPVPTAEVLAKHRDLLPETRFPSSLIFVCRKSSIERKA